MDIDLNQFHQVFFEESLDSLSIMEETLLQLTPDENEVDKEEINTIFRAAHSIKGGSGTFGFSHIANFTHVLETLLDEIRDGKRQMTIEIVDLMLQSVDCLRTLINDLINKEESDLAKSEELKAEFNSILGNGTSQTKTNNQAEAKQEASNYDIVTGQP